MIKKNLAISETNMPSIDEENEEQRNKMVLEEKQNETKFSKEVMLGKEHN